MNDKQTLKWENEFYETAKQLDWLHIMEPKDMLSVATSTNTNRFYCIKIRKSKLAEIYLFANNMERNTFENEATILQNALKANGIVTKDFKFITHFPFRAPIVEASGFAYMGHFGEENG